MKLKMIAQDEANHALGGALLACAGSAHSVATGVLLAAAVGLAWEEYQRRTKSGVYSLRDAAATTAGAIPVALPQVFLWAIGMLPAWRVLPWT